MAKKLSDSESEAMQLPRQERALLVERPLTLRLLACSPNAQT